MSPASVRRLVEADLRAYKELRDAVLLAHPEAFTSNAEPDRPPESYVSRLGHDRPEGGEFTLGAWLGGRLVGAVSCERERRAKVRHIGHVTGMMVRTEAQGSGIGRGLIESCIAEARAAHDVVLLTLTVTAGNTAAQHLYETAGFVVYGRLERAIRLEGVYHAKVQMTLQL